MKEFVEGLKGTVSRQFEFRHLQNLMVPFPLMHFRESLNKIKTLQKLQFRLFLFCSSMFQIPIEKTNQHLSATDSSMRL